MRGASQTAEITETTQHGITLSLWSLYNPRKSILLIDIIPDSGVPVGGSSSEASDMMKSILIEALVIARYSSSNMSRKISSLCKKWGGKIRSRNFKFKLMLRPFQENTEGELPRGSQYRIHWEKAPRTSCYVGEKEKRKRNFFSSFRPVRSFHKRKTATNHYLGFSLSLPQSKKVVVRAKQGQKFGANRCSKNTTFFLPPLRHDLVCPRVFFGAEMIR